MNTCHKTLLAVLVTILTACGGGGGGEAAPSLRQYAGLWKSPCFVINNSLSGQTVLRIKDGTASGNALRGSWESSLYPNTQCSGAASGTEWYYLDGTAKGTRETSAGLANKVEWGFSSPNVGTPPSPYGQLMVLKDGLLYLGDRSHIADDGYPSDVDLSIAWTR